MTMTMPAPSSKASTDSPSTAAVFDSFVVVRQQSLRPRRLSRGSLGAGHGLQSLFVHSPTGLGKTHLLQAVAQKSLESTAGQVEYLYSEDFCNQSIEALSRKALSAFRNRFHYRGCAVD